MANDIIDINITQTVETVEINATPNLTTVNINQITGGGGGGGVTNLSTTQTDTNFTINSDTGDDAIVPLANGLLAGATINDYTTPEKTKLAGIATGAEVNVNADWNATTGDAQILNKPIIPSAVTQTSQLTNNGADGLNPFITALDIPIAGQAGTIVREVKNMTGATLTKGTVVYISGANGNKALVSKALATTDALSSRTFGLLQSDILNNGLGNCVIIGDLSGLDTSAFAEGAQLYLSGVTAGTYTDAKILAPTHLVYIGKVTRSHPTQGQIEVGIQNGYEISEIHDIAIATPLNNEGIFYETSSNLWKNKSIATLLGYTPANDASVVHKTGNLSETINGIKTFSSNPVIPATGSALILSVSSGGTISGLTTTTYPDLTELALLKGVTGSAIQTQLNGKQPLNTILTNTTASFTTAYETKLSGIATGAEVNVNADWNAVSGDAQILNKPTIPTLVTETNQPYLGTIVWTGGTAPSSTTAHTYSLSQIGNLVTLTINLAYGTAGASTLTTVAVELPSTAPTPILPDSVTAVNEVIGYGNGIITVAKTIPTTNAPFCALRIKTLGTPNVYEVVVVRAQASYRYAYITIQYFTA